MIALHSQGLVERLRSCSAFKRFPAQLAEAIMGLPARGGGAHQEVSVGRRSSVRVCTSVFAILPSSFGPSVAHMDLVIVHCATLTCWVVALYKMSRKGVVYDPLEVSQKWVLRAWILTMFRFSSADVGCKSGPTLADLGPNSSEFGLAVGTIRTNFGRLRAKFGGLRATLGGVTAIWPIPSRFR